MTSWWSATDPLGEDFRAAVASELDGFFVEQVGALHAMRPDIDPLATLARTFTMGGKRLRPAFCCWGFAAAAPLPDDASALVRAAASLDLLHVSALMHDDVMDDSLTRRGIPAAHVQLATLHQERGGDGDAETFGRAGAILLGDLLLIWSSELFERSGLDGAALERARPHLHSVRTEVTGGQFLDVSAQTFPLADATPDAVAAAARVVEYKSARYTVVRPLQIGAALGGADSELIDGLARFGSPLGRAFQYRDDVLGVVGDPAVTGKPSGDDLREGKRTVLLAYALAELDDAERAELRSVVGDASASADDIAHAQELVARSGALERMERTIDEEYERALAELEGLRMRDEARTALTHLAQAAVRRNA